MARSNPHFNKVSGDYDKGRASEDLDFWAQEAERLAGLTRDSLVADMGCGTGNYGLAIQARTGATVVGFDPSPGMLRQAREKAPGLPLLQAVGEHMPFRGGVFDLVYAAQVWHHVQDRPRAAQECGRVTGKHGASIVHTIGHKQLNAKVVFRIFPEIRQSQLDAYPGDEEFDRIFRAAGFAAVEECPYSVERYQTADEFREIAEKRLWSMFRPITEEGLRRGLTWLDEWKRSHPGEPIRNDEMITLFVARKEKA